MTPSGSMPRVRGDEFGFEDVYQVGEAGASQGPGWDAAGVQGVADIGGRRRRPTGLGDLGDYDVGVVDVLVLAVGQAPLQNRPAGRVQRHRIGASAQADGVVDRIDVVHAQEPDFSAGGRVQEGQHAGGARRWRWGSAPALASARGRSWSVASVSTPVQSDVVTVPFSWQM